MVAHTSSCRNVSTSTARPSTSAVAPRRPLRTTSRNRAAGNDGKARIRRCLEVRRKMEALRRLVPSGDGEGPDEGRRLDVDELLFRAADYIVRLRLRLQVMHLMVDVLEYTED